MTFKVAHSSLVSAHPAWWGHCSSIAALLLVLGWPQGATAEPQAANVPGAGNATANTVINERGFWHGVPTAEPVEVRPAGDPRVTAAPANPPQGTAAQPRRAAATAAAGAATAAKTAPWPLADKKDQDPFPNALSYAAQPSPMTTRTLSTAPTKSQAAHGAATVVVKHSDERVAAVSPKTEAAAAAPAPKKPGGPSVVRVGDRFNDPWTRAVILTPSAQNFMETTLFGVPDFRNLGQYLQKPDTAVAMGFTDDPHPGMASDRFAGNPLTFVSTLPFGTVRSAAAR